MDFAQPQFTVDSVLFTVTDSKLHVLLVKRAEAPFQGQWSFPGGFIDIDIDECSEDTAKRKLVLKTGVNPSYLEQLRVYDGNNRDPRGFSVTLAYYALVPSVIAHTTVSSVSDAAWFNINDLSETELAFDHARIVQDALSRLQQKASYSMVPLYCCSKQFTLAELQNVIETILGKAIQRKTLMRRIAQSDMLMPLDEKVGSGGRKAQLFKVKDGVDIYHFERNLEV
jgi:ADP-ribose pyrophosphatase YjhB (NUDIX family)